MSSKKDAGRRRGRDSSKSSSTEELAVEPSESAQPAVTWEKHGAGSDGSDSSEFNVPCSNVATPMNPWNPSWGSARFWAALAMLCTLTLTIEFGLVALARHVEREQHYGGSLLVGILSTAATVYLLEWASLYGNCLHTVRRAHFDEPNVRKTYQTRAKTLGHLFMPEPPTPGPTDEQKEKAEKDWLAHMSPEELAEYQKNKKNQADAREAFRAARDAHYHNEFALALRRAKEIQAEDLTAKKK